MQRGDGWPAHIPGLLGPLLAAAVVLALAAGRGELAAWLRAFVRWPRDWRWRLATFAPLGFGLIGLAIVALLGEHYRPIRTSASPARPPRSPPSAIALAVNVFGEEAGWRGFALPRLEHRLAPLQASLVLALLWGLWLRRCSPYSTATATSAS